ncbi:pectate lyase family protein [Xanthomonas arboricola]|uniref:pectate lyase family protein n=1 Tax=Xanthomonas arboricola TaxID=56448 RepID=UPI0015C8A469
MIGVIKRQLFSRRSVMGFVFSTATLVAGTTSAALASEPVGFGAGTTGGTGGEVVDVSTPAELKNALCQRYQGYTCIDDTPRIIRLNTVIDFTATLGTTSTTGCVYADRQCAEPSGKQEMVLDNGSYCSGRTTFPLTYDNAAKSLLSVGSNKTLIGVGASAGIKGTGLSMTGGVSNIIVRNLSITDLNEGIVFGGDAISIDNASRIWIDHNAFARIGRQMIVTGWGPAKAVTISNNMFDGETAYGHYCNGRSSWIMLLIGEAEEITLLANHFHATAGRSPEIGTGGMIHLVNNLYTSNFYFGATASRDVNLLAEGNYFNPEGQYFFPVASTPGDLVFAPLDENVSSTGSLCSQTLGRSCVTSYTETGQESFLLDTTVMANIAGNATWKNAIGSVRPMMSNDVAKSVAANAGPRADPDSVSR